MSAVDREQARALAACITPDDIRAWVSARNVRLGADPWTASPGHEYAAGFGFLAGIVLELLREDAAGGETVAVPDSGGVAFDLGEHAGNA